MGDIITYGISNSNVNPEDGVSKPCDRSQQECGTDIINSYRLNVSTSVCSSVSSESDLSFSIIMDHEVNSIVNRDSDELPAFEIRLVSPLGRSPSPIDSEVAFVDSEDKTPTRTSVDEYFGPSYCQNNPDYVTLQDINAQISPANDFNRTNSLETIFEGVFLNTPPRQRLSLHHPTRNRKSLLEKIVLNRVKGGKENCSPDRANSPNAAD